MLGFASPRCLALHHLNAWLCITSIKSRLQASVPRNTFPILDKRNDMHAHQKDETAAVSCVQHNRADE